MDHGLSDQKEEYTRGFRETRGIVGAEGVYLDGDSGWVPRFNDGLVRFAMEVQLPAAMARHQPGQWHIARRPGRGAVGLARFGGARSTWWAAR